MKTAVITGAGSGVGQAVAIRFARAAWNVVLMGRRAEWLDDTARQCGVPADRLMVCPCDVGDWPQVERVGKQVLDRFGGVHLLVNAAGTNIPNRRLESLTVEDFHRVIAANLYGSFHTVRVFLPAMRSQQEGTVVNIVSDAGKQANPKAGTAYICSKFGQNGLSQAINLEEWRHGIRACSIFPGDINTPLLDRRPTPPPPEARQRMLQPGDLADCVWLIANLPRFAVVEELLIRPLGNATS